MASFPGSKTHRVSRRQLGKAQHVQLTPVTITATASTTTITLTFSEPVIVRGNIPLVSSAGELVSQTVVSETVVHQTWSTSQAAATWSIQANCAQIATFWGEEMPPRAAPFEVGLISLLSVSPSLLVFSAPVLWTAGTETEIADIINECSPRFAAGGGPAASIPIADWQGGPTPAVDDPWAMVASLTIITPAAPATGFTNSAGLVVE